MPNLVYVLFRRLRSPLIVLISVYAITMTGFVLIPGLNGQPMSFFDAFYFVSFMGTTIGFGEIHGGAAGFSYPQRAWTLVAIYATVMSWLYGVGALLSVFQDPGFRSLMKTSRFKRTVQDLREPFFLVCGYGDTGKQLVKALDDEGIQSVVIDPDEARINELELSDLKMRPLGMVGDASRSESLEAAGIKHHWCAGVIAICSDDTVNLTVAITAQLLNPQVRLIARAETPEAESNILSFGANEVINPFDTFSSRLALALHSPSLFVMFEWMTGIPGDDLIEPIHLDKGRWIICGFGRFGQTLYEHLMAVDVDVQIIEADRNKRDVPSGSVLGRPTEAPSLKKAGVAEATGIIAGTNNDADNLSTIITAKELNSDLFLVARQNNDHNTEIFQAAGIDLVMQRGSVVAHKIFALIRTPLLGDFLRIVARFKQEKANILVSRIIGVVDDKAPRLWEFEITQENSPALYSYIEQGHTLIVSDIMGDPRNRDKRLKVIPLFLKRGGGNVILPEENRILRHGDRFLMCGDDEASEMMEWSIRNYKILEYLITGDSRPSGYIMKWVCDYLEKRKAKGSPYPDS